MFQFELAFCFILTINLFLMKVIIGRCQGENEVGHNVIKGGVSTFHQSVSKHQPDYTALQSRRHYSFERIELY
jgi:hypothetical protein